MSRRVRVLKAVESLCEKKYGAAELSQIQGLTTDEIAYASGTLRNNCSAELNALVRSGHVVKMNGRPTRYLHKEWFEQKFVGGHSLSVSEYRSQEDFLNAVRKIAVESPTHRMSNDVFDQIPGARRSLRTVITQARIALQYPPHGMHVLLLGETGVGKSSFARAMHAFAVENGYLRPDAPFVPFNCAEYANNSEVLLDHLFGHVKGAFTGAISDKPGLVELADGGVLFLDEVHRLPPQGQELLFHLLDFHEFRRLGESHMSRRSRFLLFAATTEAPESVLLATFQRRIPMRLRLPPLSEWAMQDRYELIYQLCHEEAQITRKPIRLTSEAIDSLLFAYFPANIGDLKNTLKLACARAYAESALKDEIVVRRDHVQLPYIENRGLFLANRLSGLDDVVVHPESPRSTPVDIDSLYVKLDRLSQTLIDLGFGPDEVVVAVERELLRREMEHPSRQSLSELQRFLGEPFYSWVRRAWAVIEGHVETDASEQAFIRIAMHLYGVTAQGAVREPRLSTPLVEHVESQYPELYRLADLFLRAFSRESGTTLPAFETSLIALLLRKDVDVKTARMGMVVALRGNGLAQKVVETVLQIYGPAPIAAVDIPFRTTLKAEEQQCYRAIQSVQHGRGVLVFTDVPELIGFEKRCDWAPLSEPVAWYFRPDVTSICLALLIAESETISPEDIARRLYSDWHMTPLPSSRVERKTVWTCCLSGRGTAQALKRFIEQAIPADIRDRIQIIPKEMSMSGLPPEPDEGLVAVVGTVNPGLVGIPFISTEELLSTHGIDRLVNILYQGAPWTKPLQWTGHVESAGRETNMMADYVRDMLDRDLTVVNPRVMMSVADRMVSRLKSITDVAKTPEWAARFTLHCGFAVERMIRGEPLPHAESAMMQARFPTEWRALCHVLEEMAEQFRIPLHEGEIAYIFEMVFSHLLEKEYNHE